MGVSFVETLPRWPRTCSSFELVVPLCFETPLPASSPPPLRAAGFEPCQSRLIRILERLVGNTGKDRDLQAEYLYYGIPSPWLQVWNGRCGTCGEQPVSIEFSS